MTETLKALFASWQGLQSMLFPPVPKEDPTILCAAQRYSETIPSAKCKVEVES